MADENLRNKESQMERRWWAVKVGGYNDWTFAESEAEQARRNGYEVHGPFVLDDDAGSRDAEVTRLREENEALREALAELDSAHEAEGHTVRGAIGQRLRRAITDARHLVETRP